MKKIVIVRLDKACDPEVNSLEDVLELMRAPHTDDACECGCECESKKKSDEAKLSQASLDLISAIAKDLGIDVEQLKKDVIEEKYKADAKKATEAAKAKTKDLFDKLEKIHGHGTAKAETEENDTEIRVRNAIYYNGVKDGYEKGFHDVVNFMKSRLSKFIEDLDDMSKWSFKNGKLKEDAIIDIKK